MIIYKRAETEAELQQILKLQQENLPEAVPEKDRRSEGFVTVQHDLDLLSEMNNKCRHFIAVDNDQVVGYALSMHPDFGDEIEVLVPMFTEIRKQMKKDERYIVMGQICIDKSFRRKGIFRRLYREMLEGIRGDYSQIITEVDSRNKRSLDAHRSIGFKPLCSYLSDGRQWELIYLK